jgi:hypothetical protein
VSRLKQLIVVLVSAVLLLSSLSSALAETNVIDSGRMWIPWRSQFDGTDYASSNCGPASLGMAMSYYGEWWSTNGIRKSVNSYTGDWSEEGGADWESLKYAAEIRDFVVEGLYDYGAHYRQWTIDDLAMEASEGHPVVLLVRYWSLPGHEDEEWWGDHYIVVLGFTPEGDVVYHDPAFGDEYFGSYRVMSQERLMRAWSRTSSGVQYTGMAVVW